MLPTRNRADRLIETISRTVPLLCRDDTNLVIGIDEDDEETQLAISRMPADSRLKFHIAPREGTLGAKWNRALEWPADVYAIMCDYTPFVTWGFDAAILEAASKFPDGYGVVFSHMANPTFPASEGITRRVVESLSWMYPPYFPYWFVDHWIMDLAYMIDRVAFADVGLAASQQKIPTQELREPWFWATFYDAMRLMRRRQATKIISSLDDPPWRKELLIRNFPLIEFRSQTINDGVRAWGEVGADVASGGERYQRAKSAALAMMQEEMAAGLEAELEIAA